MRRFTLFITFGILLLVTTSTNFYSQSFAESSKRISVVDDEDKTPATQGGSYLKKYIDELKVRSLPPDYGQQKSVSKLITAEAVSTTNPEGDYVYKLDTSFNYTYYNYFYFQTGQRVIFETRKADPWGSDPVMYLFNYSNPTAGTWSNDDYNGYQSRLDITIPATGTYCLLLIAYNSSYPGTSDLYKDGSLYYSNAPLAGQKVYCSSISKTGELNYFTCKLSSSSDSRLWVVNSSSYSYPGAVTALNDDYRGPGDFYWALSSRVKVSTQVDYAILSSYSASSTGVCDIYLKLDNSDITSWFPNLKSDDAIKSAPASSVYNCISWSGGVTNQWIWPPSPYSPWYDPNPLVAFDKYYGNNPVRYTGAWTYTRSGATASNSIVDLWALNGSYTHGSVRKGGNDHPHGYDWESKPGSLKRTFHPRYALSGSSYGNVSNYYIRAGGFSAQYATFEEAQLAGVVIEEKVELTDGEKAKIKNLIDKLSPDEKKELEVKYNSWKATWNSPELTIQSNPEMYAQSKEYADFYAFCENHYKQALSFLFRQFDNGDIFTSVPILKLTFDQNKSVLESVRNENNGQLHTVDGKYIAPSEKANVMKYIKRLLASMD